MIAGDVLRITQYFSQNGNLAVMVSFWKVDDPIVVPINEATLAQYYHDQFFSDVAANFLHGSAFYDRTVIDNLTGGSDYGDYSKSIQGTIAGDPAPSFNAIGVKQNVANRMTRNGYKRLPYISESNMTGNVVTLASPAKVAIEQWFGEVALILDPADDSPILNLLPVVVGRLLNAEVPPYYEINLDRVNPVVSAVVNRVTSQNSRKVT